MPGPGRFAGSVSTQKVGKTNIITFALIAVSESNISAGYLLRQLTNGIDTGKPAESIRPGDGVIFSSDKFISRVPKLNEITT
jgi:hypothetical protein